MNSVQSRIRQVGALVAGVLLLATGFTGVALAASTSAFAASAVANTYGCYGLLNGFQPSGPYSFSSNAPATVAVGASYTDSISETGPITVPTTVGNANPPIVPVSVTETAVNLVFTVPTGTSLSGTPTLTGGSGAGTWSIVGSGNTVTVSAPGPLTGGSSYAPPTVNLPLTVTAAAGATIADTFPMISSTMTDDLGNVGTETGLVTCGPAASPARFWWIVVLQPPIQGPVGAIGGLVVAALLGGGLFVVTRVRRNRAVQN